MDNLTTGAGRAIGHALEGLHQQHRQAANRSAGMQTVAPGFAVRFAIKWALHDMLGIFHIKHRCTCTLTQSQSQVDVARCLHLFPSREMEYAPSLFYSIDSVALRSLLVLAMQRRASRCPPCPGPGMSRSP
eukprot:scaffold173385_cov34-Prasinocladus_malaysianus.AAC.1